MPSNSVQVNGSNDVKLNWEIPDSKMPVVTMLLNHLGKTEDEEVIREKLRSGTEHFSVTRVDDCIWLDDSREGGTEMHLVPSQAEDLIELLVGSLTTDFDACAEEEKPVTEARGPVAGMSVGE